MPARTRSSTTTSTTETAQSVQENLLNLQQKTRQIMMRLSELCAIETLSTEQATEKEQLNTQLQDLENRAELVLRTYELWKKLENVGSQQQVEGVAATVAPTVQTTQQ